ncbi:MAG: DUF4862 family protein [Propionibacteriaceae bacterium]|jgi:hypothetical protein|nr:DUF4862 family protein [Propionibacterium sp.]MDO4646609.1 DUF4862 family protein [Propionibacteriaceae bacterium]
MPEVIVGAHAAMPAERADQERFYAQLAERNLATALEIPFSDFIHEDMDWFAAQIRGRFRNCVVTGIPGTVRRLEKEPAFGLASTDDAARKAAVAWTAEVRKAAEELNQLTGEQSVSFVHIHSAPGVRASAEAFQRSLADVAADTRFSAEVVIEHCDAYSPIFPGDKRFLSLITELAVADEFGFAVNWGRSALEWQNPDRPRQHVEILAEAGRLRGLIFSGVAAVNTQWGRAWADLQLPLSTDEPASLMTPQRVAECLAASGDQPAYVGAKVKAPAGADVETRLGIISAVAHLLNS